ncbi:hypothetical protein [Clostridium senegalense]|uniref:hypothetical protein n=1 Tax=Clostridium senegalense TaxID=1465809 RepID=UPI001C11FD20|nr:hypothetical protein [Clostridium senegalense]MBU5226976.1 hypothetical protein [Clostridium senegalense]
MYVVLGNEAVDSKEFKNKIESETDFKVVKDMCKGSKREDILAYNLSVSIDILNEMIIEAGFDPKELSEDELFDEYLTVAEDLALDLEELVGEDSVLDIKAYKWDPSSNDIKLVLVIADYELPEVKVNDVVRRLLKQVE